MKHYLITILLSALLTSAFSCKQGSEPADKLILTNSLDMARKDVLVRLSPQEFSRLFGEGPTGEMSFAVPYQFNDGDQDGKADELLLLFDFQANEKKELTATELIADLEVEHPKRTQAEISHKINGEWKDREYMGGEFKNVQHLKVPPEHTDHSWFIRYEGPGWESDKVGYRFYLDWRNATDIFGKKTSNMVLQDVGQDGFDSYHEASDWGMDVLKVGSSLGIGAIGMWVEDKAERVAKTDSMESMVLANGKIHSEIKTLYYGWEVNEQKFDLTSVLSIDAGSRLTACQLSASRDIPNLCTGIVKAENAELMSNVEEASEWAYIATYGQQSLAEDKLGMAVFFKKNDLIEITEDQHSHVVVLQPTDNKVTYYFAACWEQEPDGIRSREQFEDYLERVIREKENPVSVELKAAN